MGEWRGVLTATVLLLLAGGCWTVEGLFFDQEDTGTSTFAAYVPGLWEQTTRTDFENGTGEGVAVSSAGDVALAAGGGSFMLFWEDETVPENWTSVSDEGGDYYHRFPRGAAEYGGEGGTEMHNHMAEVMGCSGPFETLYQWWSIIFNEDETECASPTHTHACTASVAPASNLPLYRDLKVIRYDGGIPCIIPAGAIGIFEDLPTRDWEQAYGDDRYLRGGAVTGTGGSQNHTHEVTVTTGAASDSVEIEVKRYSGGIEIEIAGSDHTHERAGTTAAGENEPPFIAVRLGRAESDTVVPLGLIAMHTAKPGEGWSVVSDFEGYFIRDTGTYEETGGTEMHTHATLTVSTDGPTTLDHKRVMKFLIRTKIAHPTHTHTLDLSFSEDVAIPPYRDTIFARAEYPLEGTLESVVFDTGIEGATWNAFFWDRTTEDGVTGIEMAVRASDTPFEEGDAGWTDPAGGLPKGRYMQWRATLTTTDSTQTPVLHAVRVYYY